MSSSRLRNQPGHKRVSGLEALIQAKKSGQRLIEQVKLNDELIYESLSEDEFELSSRKRGNKNTSVIIDELYGYDDEEDENEDVNRKHSKSKRAKIQKAEAERKPLPAAFIKRKQAVSENSKSVSSKPARMNDAYAEEVLESLMNSEEPVTTVTEDHNDGDQEELALFGRTQQIAELQQAKAEPPDIDLHCSIPEFMVSSKAKEPVVEPEVVNALDQEPTDYMDSYPDLCIDDLELDGKPDITPVAIGVVKKEDKPSANDSNASIPSDSKQDFRWLKEKQSGTENRKIEFSNLIGEDNSLQLFWLDAYEDPGNAPGKIFLFGKAKASNDSNTLVSCCVIVENICRNVFVMPRSNMVEDPDDPSTETSQEVTMTDVYDEFLELTKKHNIPLWKAKPVTRKYAFDNPDGRIALEADVLKVVYAADLPALPRDTRGRSFSHLFGSQTPCLENFLLKRKLMGPQWLRIENVVKSTSLRSWCNVEFTTESPKNVKKIEDNTSPTISVLSLSILCSFNPQTQQNEVVAASGLLHSEVSVDGATSDPDALSHFAIIRPITGQSWPSDLQNMIGRHGISLNVCPNERALLSFLATKIHLLDPDVIAGHNLYSVTLDILLNRMAEFNFPQWSKLGRLRRSGYPRLSRNGYQSNFFVSSVSGGRLFCDTALSSKELIRETSYDLTHLSQVLLNIKRESIDVSKMMSTSADIINVVRYCSNDAYLALSVMFRLQILPLTKQLTVLGGHTWAKSLQSARAQRVEFLLLHEFHRLKYIKPEKYSSSERRKIQQQSENGTAEYSKKRKPAYSGGLVLEPIKGFYDSYILLLDFNSLYPSIIQEFNLCFTTVKHWQWSEGSDLPDVPSESEPFGVLPRVIKTLVARRQGVKGLLKTEQNPVIRQEYDIRQQALKLVANSMYGCLGFPGSRFYCKSLAALITFQGRSILKKTVDTIESLNYKVIYGDTDSVCIATNSTDLEMVKKIGSEIKREINKLYKTLEIEIDGIFKSLLLLQKKKYAALVVSERDGKIFEKKEIKGLEMVRRDWCPLSKRIGEQIIDIILSTASRDDVVDSIHSLLSEVAQKTRNSQIELNDFIITKGLSKHPSEYSEAASLPHVAVALQMIENGEIVRVGDHIPYVICQINEKSSLFHKARHPSTLQNNPDLILDYEWYLSQQLLPPVLRLCAHIEGTDANRLADCLGLVGSRYYNHAHSNVQDDRQQESFQTVLQLRQFDDEEAFKTVRKLQMKCPYCKSEFEFKGVFDMNRFCSGLKCPSTECSKSLDDPSSTVFISKEVASYFWRETSTFNELWDICEDKSCNQRCHNVASCNICTAPVHRIYKDSDLYLAIRYLISLFDINRAYRRMAQENIKRSRQSLPPIDLNVTAPERSVLESLKTNLELLLLNDSEFCLLDAKDVFGMFLKDQPRTSADIAV